MLPTQREIHLPLLMELARRGGASSPSALWEGRTIPDALAEEMGLSSADLAETVDEASRGYTRSKWNNRVRFARNDLVKLRLVDGATHGVWKLTAAGRVRLQQHEDEAPPGHVVSRPVDPATQRPDVDQVAHDIEHLELILLQEGEQGINLAASCSEVNIRNPTGSIMLVHG